MIPLTCVNCCHNPLQLGLLGTAFGHCTRRGVVLNQPHQTTCGQQLRKDLLADSAQRQRVIHSERYTEDLVVLVTDAHRPAAELGLTEQPNGEGLLDPVVDEVQNYGQLDSKIASMAALHRIQGARTEVARLSLSRAYFANCVARRGKWTAGVHLLNWTLGQLDQEPAIGAADIQGPLAVSLHHTIRVTRWNVIALRLAFASDVGRVAAKEEDPAGVLATLAGEAAAAAGNDPDQLLRWLQRTKRRWSAALSRERYTALKAQLHVREDDG